MSNFFCSNVYGGEVFIRFRVDSKEKISERFEVFMGFRLYTYDESIYFRILKTRSLLNILDLC